MNLKELHELCVDIDDVLIKRNMTAAECVYAMSFSTAKVLYALGISRNQIEGAALSISNDIVESYNIIDSVVNKNEEVAN